MSKQLNIKAALRAAGMSATQLAEKLETSKMNVNAFLNGRKVGGKFYPPAPSVTTLQRIAGAIGCDLFDLFTDDDQSEQGAKQLPAVFGFVDYGGTVYRITSAAELLRLADTIRQDLGGEQAKK